MSPGYAEVRCQIPTYIFLWFFSYLYILFVLVYYRDVTKNTRKTFRKKSWPKLWTTGE